MTNTVPRKNHVLPREAIRADELLSKMLKTNNFQVANSRLRGEFVLKNKTNSLTYERDRLKGYIHQTTLPALQKHFTERMYINNKINNSLFQLHVLGKQNLISYIFIYIYTYIYNQI